MKISGVYSNRIVFYLTLALAGVWIFHSINILLFNSRWNGRSADCALILGAAIWGSEPSPVYRSRIDYGIELAKNGHVKRIIFTGGVGYGKGLSEGEVGKNYALKNGLQGELLFVEDKSRTTKENLVNSLPILKTERCNTVLIVSDPLHLKRAVEIAKDLEINASPAATPSTMFRSWKTKLELLISETYYLLQYRIFGYG